MSVFVSSATHLWPTIVRIDCSHPRHLLVETSLLNNILCVSFLLFHAGLLQQDSLDEGLSYHGDSDSEHPSNASASLCVCTTHVPDLPRMTVLLLSLAFSSLHLCYTEIHQIDCVSYKEKIHTLSSSLYLVNQCVF